MLTIVLSMCCNVLLDRLSQVTQGSCTSQFRVAVINLYQRTTITCATCRPFDFWLSFSNFVILLIIRRTINFSFHFYINYTEVYLYLDIFEL